MPTVLDAARANAGLVKSRGFAVVTLGADGALLISAERHRYIHMHTRPNLSTREHWIGAGDTLFGTFAGAVWNGVEVDVALARGIAAAAIGSDPTTASTAINHADVDEVLSESSGWVSLT